MLANLQIKIAVIAICLLLTLGGGWYIKHLIAKNAVLEASLESTASALRDYALDVEENHQKQVELNDTLRKEFEFARAESNDLKKRLAENDIQKLFNEDPANTELSINIDTMRLLVDLSKATGNATRTENTTAPKP